MTRLTPWRSGTVALALMTAVAGTVGLGLAPAAPLGHPNVTVTGLLRRRALRRRHLRLGQHRRP